MAELDDDDKFLYGDTVAEDNKIGIADLFEKKLGEINASTSLPGIGGSVSAKVEEKPKNASVTENDDEDSYEEEDDDDDDDDDVQVTIDEISTTGAYGAPFGAGVNWAPKGAASTSKPATGASGDAKRLDLDAVGTVKDVSIYEYDIDLGTDEKPWRKPGADITDYFNYGFSEDTWKQYCERQRRLRMDISGQRKIYTLGAPTSHTLDPAGIFKPGPPPDRKQEGTIDVIGSTNLISRRPQDEHIAGFQPPELNFAARPGGFPRQFPGPMQVAPPRMFHRHPNLLPGMRPPFMQPPMGPGLQVPVVPQSEPNVSMANPAVSGAPTSSAAPQVPGSAPDGGTAPISTIGPPQHMMPPMGAPVGQMPPHMFGVEGFPPGMQMPPGMPGAPDMFGRGQMDPFMPPSGPVPGMFPPWDMNAVAGDFSRSPERGGSDAESDSESRRHRRRDKDRHREHRDRDRDSTRDKDRDRDRERRHRDRESRRDRDKDKDKERSRTRDKERSSRREKSSREHKSDRKKHRSVSKQRDESEDTETPRKRSRKSRQSIEDTAAFQDDGAPKEEAEATDE